MNSDEFYEYEDRAYIQPTLSSGEQEKFISNLRDLQTKNNAQIAQQTYNLGTAVPSNLGGLGGGEAYFTSRYQVPQVNEMVNTLKAAAKAQELNDAMSNYQAQLKNQYSQAQRAYNKRQRARAAAGYGGYGSDGSTGGYDTDGVIDVRDTSLPYGGGKVSSWTDSSSPYSMTSYGYSPTGELITEYYNPNTGNTYKYVGDKLSFINGEKAGILGNVYDFTYKQLGRFPNDN